VIKNNKENILKKIFNILFLFLIYLFYLAYTSLHRLFNRKKHRPIHSIIYAAWQSPHWRCRLGVALRPDTPSIIQEYLKMDANIYVRKVAHEVEKDPKLIEKLFALTPQITKK
jgi:hypothetical protein